MLPARYPNATIAGERVPLQVSSKALTGPTDPPGSRLAGQGLTLRTAYDRRAFPVYLPE